MSAIRSLRVMVPVLALGLLAWAQAPARAEEAAVAKGTITGKVVDATGAPAANVKIRLLPAKEHKKAKEAAEATEKKAKHEAVAETNTDSHGAFTLADIPVGDYTIAATEKGFAAHDKVAVAAGKTTDVTLTLKAVEKAKKDKNN